MKGKLIRKSLKTDLLSIGKRRPADFAKQERQRAEPLHRQQEQDSFRPRKSAQDLDSAARRSNCVFVSSNAFARFPRMTAA